jgi:2'-5' RNA ligase
MKRRLFVAIPIPEQTRKEIQYALDRIDPDIFSYGRETEEGQWHITLNFFGEQEERIIPDVIAVIQEVKKMCAGISIVLKHIDFESGEKRMMWAHGDNSSSQKLGEIHEYIFHRLSERHVHVHGDFSRFTTHVTLMRFSRRPHKDVHIHEGLNISFPLVQIDLMESELSHEGPEYTILHSEMV